MIDKLRKYTDLYKTVTKLCIKYMYASNIVQNYIQMMQDQIFH